MARHVAPRAALGLRLAAATGIGLLLTFIGLRNAGIVEGDPATLVRLGTIDHRAALLLLGVVVAVLLYCDRDLAPIFGHLSELAGSGGGAR